MRNEMKEQNSHVAYAGHYRLTAATVVTCVLTMPVVAQAALNPAFPATTWTALASTAGQNAAANVSCGAACDSSDPIFLVDGTTEVARAMISTKHRSRRMSPDTRKKSESSLADLQRQREMLETGKMGTGGKVLGSTTAESLARFKAQIVELQGLLTERPDNA